ncbi:MAG: arginine repressor [Faecalibacterium sp.]|nr:arginine repressor [Faecalibacterium sp.]
MRKPMQESGKSKQERLQAILRLIEEHPINRQEELLRYLRAEGFDVTQATVSRDIRELNLVKASAENGGYRYVAGHTDRSRGSKNLSRFEMIFRESVLKVDYAGHIVLVKCYSGMANAACEVFDAMNWPAVVGTLSGDDTFFVLARTEHDAKSMCAELSRYTTA